LALTVVPFLCYLLFRPVRLSKKIVWGIAGDIGVTTFFVAHALMTQMLGESHYNGWSMAAAIGTIAALVFVRMTREPFLPMDRNPVSQGIARVYTPMLRWVLANKKTFIAIPAAIFFVGLTLWLGAGVTLAPVAWGVNLFAYEPASPELKKTMYRKQDEEVMRPLVEFDQLRWQKVQEPDGSWHRRMVWRRPDPVERDAETARGVRIVEERGLLAGIGREFMPPLDEGAFLYMPSLLPQAGFGTAVEVSIRQDRIITEIPEVASVVGKVGRAESALDPAPVGMMESIVVLKPENEWRQVPVPRWFSGWPSWLKTPLVWVWPEQRSITKGEILAELQEKTAIPGVLPTFLQPIQTRLIMLQTGFRAMMGVKIYGSDLKEIERIGLEIETLLRDVPGATDIVADRIVGKPYLEFEIDRDRIARYGVSIRDVQDIIEIAIGGMNVTESVEGRERYPVRVRYLREFREDMPELEKILVPTSDGTHVPLAQGLTIRSVLGPQEIKGERSLLVGYVTMNTRDRDEVGVVEDAEATLQTTLRDGRLRLPPGYYWEWSGQFENQVRATNRMRILIPVCLAIMFVMLYLGFRRWWIAPIVYIGILVSASGGFILLALWGSNLSVAVWVGFLVLFGVVDDDGVLISTYLERVFDGAVFDSTADIREAVLQAGLMRIRLCLMTISTTVFGLLSIFWATGRGADVMQPMAIPSIGGMAVSLLTIFIAPCLFCAVEEWKWNRARRMSFTGR